MTRPDDIEALVGEEARRQAKEVEEWREAVEKGDVAALPPDAPGLDVLGPLSDAEKAAMVGDLFGVMPAPAPAPVVPLYRRRAVVGAMGALLAAGVAAIALRPSGPSYHLEVSAGDQVLRSREVTPTDAPTVSRGSQLELVLQPREALASGDGLDAPEVLAVDDAGQSRPVVLAWQRGVRGGFRCRVELGRELDLAPGRWTVIIEVGSSRFEQRLIVSQ